MSHMSNWCGKWLSSRAQQPAVPWASHQRSHRKMPPLAARTLFCANTCAAFCSKPFGERREATGLLSSATRERLQKCFNNFPDICCNIQQLGARASALASLPYPRGGNVCMCWQPCGRFSVGPLFRFMHPRLGFGSDVLVFCFFLWENNWLIYFVEILITILIIAWMTHQCTLKRQGIRFVCYIVQISSQIKRHGPNWWNKYMEQMTLL